MIHPVDAIEGDKTQKRGLYDYRGPAIPKSDGEA